jgi:hypothetical protein
MEAFILIIIALLVLIVLGGIACFAQMLHAQKAIKNSA